MNKRNSLIFVIILLVVLATGWYLLSPLFLDKVVNEELPLQNSTSDSTNENNELLQGSFVDADGFHKVSGQARIITSEGKTYLYLENFESTNGPDLKVYLSEDKTAKSYVSLGPLKGNIGNQFYEIPDGTDFEKYDTALIWCEQFSVLFGSAELG